MHPLSAFILGYSIYFFFWVKYGVTNATINNTIFERKLFSNSTEINIVENLGKCGKWKYVCNLQVYSFFYKLWTFFFLIFWCFWQFNFRIFGMFSCNFQFSYSKTKYHRENERPKDENSIQNSSLLENLNLNRRNCLVIKRMKN